MTALADQLWEDAGAPILEEFFGVSVVFCRGSEQSAAFTATPDTTNYGLIDGEGATTIFDRRDYTFPVSAPVVNGVALEPMKRDKIKETINGVEHVYQLEPLGDKPAAQLLAGGFRWLVHTKRVS